MALGNIVKTCAWGKPQACHSAVMIAVFSLCVKQEVAHQQQLCIPRRMATMLCEGKENMSEMAVGVNVHVENGEPHR